MANLNLNVNTYEDLQSLMNDESMFPFGTTCNVSPADLLAGNFEVAHFERPPFPTSDGKMIDVSYSGPVIEPIAE